MLITFKNQFRKDFEILLDSNQNNQNVYKEKFKHEFYKSSFNANKN